jgi:4-alpha-glucanotransferase
LHEWGTKLADRIMREKFFQYLFFRHWFALKEYCNNKGIQIIGDIPLYVDYNSATVWKTPEIFKLDDIKKPIFVAGVPPDYFSETGQLWGNPVFDWDKLRSSGYDWWIKRIRHNFKLYDLLRLDHFRGLVAYWEVYAGEKTAINGKWVATPVQDFFNALLKHFPTLPSLPRTLAS